MVQLPAEAYPVHIAVNSLRDTAELIRQYTPARQIVIITNPLVDGLYGDRVRQGFTPERQVLTLHVPDCETSKSAEQTQRLYTELISHKIERGAVIIALGGGVIGDLAGFVAATYLRGVALVQIPTTLLAQVDSSIGGKVGVNHPLGKNLIGAFKQPLFVSADVSALQTLDDAEIRCGLGEVIKYGFILNRPFFEFLEVNLEKALLKDEATLQEIVRVCVAEKARVVEQDEKEAWLRMALNFGHTFGHALERLYNFSQLKHGEAVILGMKSALVYARLRGMLDAASAERGMALLNRVPVVYDKSMINPERLTEFMSLDKKVKSGKVRLVLINEIGKNFIEESVDISAIKESFGILVN
jgi:3-dehydroquinate synthase